MSEELSKAERRAESWRRANARSGDAADHATAARGRVNQAAEVQRARIKGEKPGTFNDPASAPSRPEDF